MYLEINYSLETRNEQYGNHIANLQILSRKPSSKKWKEKTIKMEYTIISVSSKQERRPIAELSKEHLSLGRIKKGDIKTESFAISNEGSAPLNIFHVEADPYIQITPYPTILSPGETCELKIIFSFNTKIRDYGRILSTITLYTDSAYKPVQRIYVTYIRVNTVEAFIRYFSIQVRDWLKINFSLLRSMFFDFAEKKSLHLYV